MYFDSDTYSLQMSALWRDSWTNSGYDWIAGIIHFGKFPYDQALILLNCI